MKLTLSRFVLGIHLYYFSGDGLPCLELMDEVQQDLLSVLVDAVISILEVNHQLEPKPQWITSVPQHLFRFSLE
jgi:hypothetical protein